MKRRSFLSTVVAAVLAPLGLLGRKPENLPIQIDWDDELAQPSEKFFVGVSQVPRSVDLLAETPNGELRVIASKLLEVRRTGMQKILYARFP
jgi:hypothetical protein